MSDPAGAAAADVVVVGAGPAGVAAAIGLARAGRDVLVVDKARFPRDKCCGDGLTTGALRLLEHLGLDPATVPSWQTVEDVTLRSPSGRQVHLPLPRDRGTYAAVARRTDLDAALVALARAAGAGVVEGAAVTGATAQAGRVDLRVDTLGTVSARYAVGADGVWSPLRKALGAGIPGYLGEWQAFRRYYHSVGPDAGRLHVWFEPDLLPGYAWSFPLAGGKANVGFGVLRGTTGTGGLANLWPSLVGRPHVRAVLGPDATAEGPHKAWPIPARVGAVRLAAAGGRALFVGDAAAAGDPMTGEGIGQALLSGVLAARAIAAAGPDDPDGAARRYRADVHDELGVDASVSGALGRVLRRPWGARGAVRVAGSTDWSRRHFARWLFEDYPRAYLATPSRWLRYSLVGDGAWAPPAP